MPAGSKWTEDETKAAFALYFELPTGKHDKKTPEVIQLAEALGRTPSSVATKLANIRAHDPQRSSAKGLTHTSKLDQEVWELYSRERESFLESAVRELHTLTKEAKHNNNSSVDSSTPLGKERLVKEVARVNQTYFRNSLLENYRGQCCMTGLHIPTLLIASHIKPWNESDPAEKVAADNGLLLNALHDKAFDIGLITIDDRNGTYKIRVSSKVPKDETSRRFIWRYEGQEITRPIRMPPRHDFIEYHNDVVFQG